MPFRRTSVDSSQRTGFYSPKRSRVVGSRLVFPTDPDAAAYIAAVESADGQELEFPVKVAYNDFVLGCKSDGIWAAIKASCIMAGARTLAGALTPLVGTAPTNNNFVAGDYNRTTGLVGDGSTKYLDTNRAANADPQNNHHISIYQTHPNTLSRFYLGSRTVSPINVTQINNTSVGTWAIHVRNDNPNQFTGSVSGARFAGGARQSSSQETRRNNGVNTVFSNASLVPPSFNYFVFACNQDGVPVALADTGRFSFYSIGESLDLALLDSRVTMLMADLALALDADVQAYVSAVETADGQALELEVKRSYAKFIVGCKADGIWTAIKASCIMAGARTLAGALTPLVGTAPTNNNFVAGDYNRKTGLVGDGSTKYLDTNRASNADPQNSLHQAVSLSTAGTTTTFRTHIGTTFSSTNADFTDILALNDNSLVFRNRNGSATFGVNYFAAPAGSTTDFLGSSRAASNNFDLRYAGSTSNISSSPQNISYTPSTANHLIFARNGSPPTLFSDARIYFYSIGESLDLALLDSRVTTLMADIAAAIP